METKVTKFGSLPDGRVVNAYELRNSHGLTVRLINFGATITHVFAPDRQGRLGDVVLGFDELAPYLGNHPYLGCTIGRVANRIARGRFTLDGKTYSLPLNNGPNSLHGGISGFSRKLWQAEPIPRAAGVRMSYRSPDGEEGYPGNLETSLVVTLAETNELVLDYTATADQPTPINLTNHSYFNFRGKGTVLDYELMIAAEEYTPRDEHLIPTGEIKPVANTPLDFRRPTPIGARFPEIKERPVGYDNNFVLSGAGLRLAARAYDPQTGRGLEVRTTEPGVQLYTANFLDGSQIGKSGIAYGQHSGFCLETQNFPDAVNHPHFPACILRPGKTYRQTTTYQFNAR